jgi:hypothetical protein
MLRASRVILLVPVIVALLSLAIYLATLLPEVEWGDSAELALQAHQLGVTHPTGYPVHSVLGRLFVLLAGDPTLGVNLLSAVCTSLAVGLLCIVAGRLTGNWVAAGIAAVAFAVSPFIWERAVVCEINNVNVCFVALSVSAILFWHHRPSYGTLALAAVVFGLSLGTYLANLLLLPGLVFLVVSKAQRRVRSAILFVLIVAVLGTLVLSWNVFRSRVLPPIGTEYVPDSAGNLIRYLSGAQYETTALHGARFYVQRFAEHGLTFAKNFLGIGILIGLLGVRVQWKKQRDVCIALLLMFVADMAYFTGFAVLEYAYLVTPSYLIFAIWIAHGIAHIWTLRSGWSTKAVAVALSGALVLGLFVWKLPARLERRATTPVSDFVRWSFEVLPEDSVAIGSWGKFTALLYFQTAYGLRQDLTIYERIAEPRHYGAATVNGWREAAVKSATQTTPVFIDRLIESEADGLRVIRFIGNGFNWVQLQTVM